MMTYNSKKSLKCAWEKARVFGVQVQQTNGDGYKAWQTFKPTVNTKTPLDLRWNHLPKHATLMRPFFESMEKGGTTKNCKERGHFLSQLVRIPAKEECNVLRILQIAYNLGQLQGLECRVPTTDWSNWTKTLNLDTLETYVVVE